MVEKYLSTQEYATKMRGIVETLISYYEERPEVNEIDPIKIEWDSRISTLVERMRDVQESARSNPLLSTQIRVVLISDTLIMRRSRWQRFKAWVRRRRRFVKFGKG